MSLKMDVGLPPISIWHFPCSLPLFLVLEKAIGFSIIRVANFLFHLYNPDHILLIGVFK
jgi:hypothetical protein